MGRAQCSTYSSLFNKSDNVNVVETFVQKSVFVHVLIQCVINYKMLMTYFRLDKIKYKQVKHKM